MQILETGREQDDVALRKRSTVRDSERDGKCGRQRYDTTDAGEPEKEGVLPRGRRIALGE